MELATSGTSLHFARNRLSVYIPTEIGLESIWLSQNRIEGVIPTEIGLPTALSIVDASGNRISGTFTAGGGGTDGAGLP